MNFPFWANIIALLFSFFVVGAVLGAVFSESFRRRIATLVHPRLLALVRSLHNPILSPGTNPWTAEAVMNPAAAVLGGRTHLIYRAIGMDGVSRLGYASSPDGILFDDRLPYPVYVAEFIKLAPAECSPVFSDDVSLGWQLGRLRGPAYGGHRRKRVRHLQYVPELDAPRRRHFNKRRGLPR